MPAEKIVWNGLKRKRAPLWKRGRTKRALAEKAGADIGRTEERTLGKSGSCAAAVQALKARSEISAGAEDMRRRNFPRLFNSQSWPFLFRRHHCIVRARKSMDIILKLGPDRARKYLAARSYYANSYFSELSELERQLQQRHVRISWQSRRAG